MALFFSIWIKLFFVLTPFFGLTMFLSLTEKYDPVRRRKLAISVSLAVGIICVILFFLGKHIFAVFGITLDSFRIGAGVLLLLSGIALVQGKAAAGGIADGDVAVVPLAIPIIVGPATMGTILVMGAELHTWLAKAIGCAAMLCAVICIGMVLLTGAALQKLLGTRGISILSRLTGLIISALSAQMIMTGVRGFLEPAIG